jgi:hypothetical protein
MSLGTWRPWTRHHQGRWVGRHRARGSPRLGLGKGSRARCHRARGSPGPSLSGEGRSRLMPNANSIFVMRYCRYLGVSVPHCTDSVGVGVGVDVVMTMA